MIFFTSVTLPRLNRKKLKKDILDRLSPVMSQKATATAMDPAPANSPSMHSRKDAGVDLDLDPSMISIS